MPTAKIKRRAAFTDAAQSTLPTQAKRVRLTTSKAPASLARRRSGTAPGPCWPRCSAVPGSAQRAGSCSIAVPLPVARMHSIGHEPRGGLRTLDEAIWSEE